MSERASIKHKDIAKLIKSAKDRRKQGRYIVEGIKMVLEAVNMGIAEKVFVSEEWWNEYIGNGNDSHVFDVCGFEVLERQTFKQLTDTVTPQGIIAVVSIKSNTVGCVIEKAVRDDCCRLLILENLQDPGNLGTILRTAEAAGYKGVLMNKGTVDIYNPKVVRSTMGAIFRVPFAYADEVSEIIEACRKKGITVYGAALEGKDIREEKYDDALAFIIGNESAGMTAESKEACDKLVRIPMCGEVESLNASVAASILMYISNLSLI